MEPDLNSPMVSQMEKDREMLLGWEQGSSKFRWEKGRKEGTDRNYVTGQYQEKKVPIKFLKALGSPHVLRPSKGVTRLKPP